tara:strand:+ start:242 stop:475 length:234 start_codon:yes stop_codon:yes gene_type:complete
MKTNAYKVVVSIKDTETMNSSDDIVDIDAFTAMDAHREVQDKIDWRLQEITEVFLVKDKIDKGGQLVYSIADGFIEE